MSTLDAYNSLEREYNKLKRQRDALLEACEELLKSVLDEGCDFEGNPVTDKARAAIAQGKKLEK